MAQLVSLSLAEVGQRLVLFSSVQPSIIGVDPRVRYAQGMEGGSLPETALEREIDERFRAAYDENGVDRSLIRLSLAQTPTERVMGVEETLNALATVRRIPPPR